MGSSPQSGGGRKMPKGRKRVRLLYENRISFYSFLVALPGTLVGGILIWMQAWSTRIEAGVVILRVGCVVDIGAGTA